MGISFVRPKAAVAVAIAAIALLAGAAAVTAPAANAVAAPVPAADSTGYSLTVVARLCPSFTDVQANRARNNIQETYSDLGIDANPPYSDNMAANPISPAREDSANAAGYDQCSAIPDWTFSLGTGLAAYGANGVGNADHISVVTTNGTPAASATAVTSASTPELNDGGQYLDAAGNVVTDPAEAVQLPGATTIQLTAAQVALANRNALWVQGGKAHAYAAGATNTNEYQLNADQTQFAKADGTPLYSFASLRCVTDDYNGDNVESVSLNSSRVHGYCFAYYVGTNPKPGTITVVKNVTSPTGNGKTFNFAGNVSFTPGSGDADTDPFTVKAGGSGTSFARASSAAAGGQVWTVQEPAGANPGWALDSLLCTSTGGSTFTYSVPSGGVNTRANITLAEGDDVTCTATNSPLTDLTVQKLDSTTGQPVAGAGFALYQGTLGSAGVQVGTCTTAGVAGTCTVAGVAPGSYYWLETSAPTGYTLDPNPVGVVITPASAGTAISTAVSDDESPTVLSVHKVDAANNADLAGAVFALHAGSATGATVGTCTSARNGLCTVTVTSFGTYVWVETTAPADYLLTTDTPTVDVTAANAGTQDASFTSTVADIHKIITGGGSSGGSGGTPTPVAPVPSPTPAPVPATVPPIATGGLAFTGPAALRLTLEIGFLAFGLGGLLCVAARRRRS